MMEIRAEYSDDQVQDLMRLAGDRAEERFRLAVRPIYGASARHVHEHIGSSVLLEIDGRRLIITAAHIIDMQTQMVLRVAGESRLIPLRNRFFDTEPPNGARGDDHHDIAFSELSSWQVRALGAVRFVTEGECVPTGVEARGRLFTAIGFPNSRNKGPWIDGRIGGKRYQYTAGVRLDADIAGELGVSGKNHLFIDHQNLLFDEVGHRALPIGPVGLSGGAVVESRVLGGQTMTPRLGAIIVERRKAHRVLVATKIASIIEGIREALPASEGEHGR
jgi:hypothetical protein